ncbi:MAG: DsbA family protein [Rhodospirillaceae bacterium]
MRQGLRWVAVLAGLWLSLGVGAALAEPPSTEAALADRILGDPKAPVTMFDFSSLTCPHCGDFHTKTLPELKSRYIDTGKLKVVFRDFPLDRNALHAAMLARCAPAARYYGFLDVLFKSQQTWGRSPDPKKALAQIGALGGVPGADFEACLAMKPLEEALIARTYEAQKKYGISSTPTFVFNDGAEKIEGALPLEKFQEIIDKLLKP